MNISIDRSTGIPLYLQISSSIEKQITDGIIKGNTRLPSERTLASELGIHRNTVIKAYDVLLEKRLITSSRKKPMGYYVIDDSDLLFSRRFFPLKKSMVYKWDTPESLFADMFWKIEGENTIPMSGMIMDRSIGPELDSVSAVKRFTDSNGRHTLESYLQETDKLKDNICSILSQRNIHVTSREVQIIAETNQGISYLINMFLQAGDTVVCESPLLPDIRNLFTNKRVNLAEIPMEEDGMNMSILEESIVRYKPKFIYTMPTFHNPTGVTMSIEKRYKLLELAHRYNIPIIEDAYPSVFCYDGKYIPPLFYIDKTGSVIYLDSFTLSLPYETKIGFLVGPEDLVARLYDIISIDETVTSNLGQYFVNEYIESGYYTRHLNLVRSQYRNKLNLLARELSKYADTGLTFHKPDGGVLLWLTLPHSVDGRVIFREASKRGLMYMPGWIFYSDPSLGQNKIRLSFSNVTDEQIIKGVEILGELIRLNMA